MTSTNSVLPSPDARAKGVRTASTLGLLLIPLLAISSAVLLFVVMAATEREDAAVRRSYETRLQIQKVFSLLQDAETGQRGYLITGRESFLEPYTLAVSKLDQQLAQLDDYIRHDADVRPLMPRLHEAVAEKLTAMSVGMAIRANDGAQPAADYVRQERGKRAMDSIRVVTAQMMAREEARLAERERRAELRRVQAQWAAAALAALLLASLGAATVLLRRNAQARERLLLRFEEESLRQTTIFDSTLDAIVTLNPSGSIESANRAAGDMFGYSREDLLRRDSATLVDFAPGEGLFLRRLALRGDPSLGVAREFTARRRDGATFPVEVSLGTMRLHEGVRIVAAIRDITERKEAERLKDEFVSTVSHELRTPLTSIAGSLGLIDGGVAGELPDKARRLVRIARTSCDRLVRLINDLLDMQRIASGRIQMEERLLDLRTVVTAAVEATSGMAAEAGVDVSASLPDDPAPVRGDSDRLVQVLVNLLSNAIKFSPRDSRVKIVASAERSRVQVTVHDQGPGVPEAFQASLFGRFAQADSSAIRATGGSGLGLAISREIAERHRGILRLVESSSAGAVFGLELPRAETPAESAALQVLICEQDAEAAEQIGAALQAQGFAPVVTPSLGEAEAALRSHAFAALLLGLRHKDGDAISMAHRLRADGVRLPPAIIVSGEPRRARGALPIAGWVSTPVDPMALRDTVRNVLSAEGGLHILHVDDDLDLTAVVAAALEPCGSIQSVHTLADARAAVRRRRPDLVILDLALPDGSGLELLPALRAKGEPPPVLVYSGQEMDPALLDRVEAVLTKSRVSFDALTRTVKELAGGMETPA